MSLENCDFAGVIRNAAAALGRAPTDTQVEVLNETIRSLASIDPTSNNLVVEGEVFDAYLNRAVDAFPKPAPVEPPPAKPEWVKIQVGTSTGWRHVDDPYLKVKASIDGDYDAKLEAEMQRWPNPFSKRSWNRTRQTIMQNKNPALAADMKAKAAQ